MNEGYVKIYRKTVTSQVFQNEGLFKVWMWCLLKANHEGRWVSVKSGKGSTEVWIGPGQFIFGRKSAAKELKMKPSTVWKRIVKLKNMRNLNIESNSQYSIITLVNWEFYQGGLEKGTSKVTAKEQPRNTNKNVKKNIFRPNSDEFRLSELLLNLILERRPTWKNRDLQKWAQHVDYMIRLDNRDPEEIQKVIEWCQADTFWQNNILSTAKLREQFDQLALKMGEQKSEIRWDEKTYGA